MVILYVPLLYSPIVFWPAKDTGSIKGNDHALLSAKSNVAIVGSGANSASSMRKADEKLSFQKVAAAPS